MQYNSNAVALTARKMKIASYLTSSGRAPIQRLKFRTNTAVSHWMRGCEFCDNLIGERSNKHTLTECDATMRERGDLWIDIQSQLGHDRLTELQSWADDAITRELIFGGKWIPHNISGRYLDRVMGKCWALSRVQHPHAPSHPSVPGTECAAYAPMVSNAGARGGPPSGDCTQVAVTKRRCY